MSRRDKKCPKRLFDRYRIVPMLIVDNAVISQKSCPQGAARAACASTKE